MTAALTPEQAAAQLQVKAPQVIRLCRSGRLRSVKIGRDIRIPPEAITEFLACGSRSTGASGAPSGPTPTQGLPSAEAFQRATGALPNSVSLTSDEYLRNQRRQWKASGVNG
jgi:excisionase family DNA binding protein